MHYNDDFMNYIGFRSSEIDQRIDEAVTRILNSDGHVSIDFSDLHLTGDEQRYVETEIRRRLNNAS